MISMVCLALCFGIAGCGVKEKPPEKEIIVPVHRNDITQIVGEIVDSIFNTLTLEEKIGECLMPSIYSSNDAATLSKLRNWIDTYHIGGVVLLKGDTKSAESLAKIGAEAKVPLFMAIDAEWGLGMRLTDAPVYSKNGNLGQEAGEVSLYDYGRQIAKECKELGINMVLGPVVDLNSKQGGVMGKRSFGSDPGLVSEYGVAYAKGVESGGVMSVAKHFPGHGGAYRDSHLGVARINKNITALDTMDLKPFKEYINSGLSGVMAGHIEARSLDPDGLAASVSIDMLTSLLREELGFQGLILTDAFDMGGAKGFSATDALIAGADIVLCPLNVKKEFQDVLESVNSGSLDVEVLNERVRRILFYKVLFTGGYTLEVSV